MAWLCACALTALALLGIAHAQGEAPTADTDRSVLRVAVMSPLWTVDPLTTSAHLVRDHGYMVYDTLFGVDATMTPRYQMLASHSVAEGGLVYRFTLRDGLIFHDGTTVTADDAVASIRRWGALDPLGRALMAATESLSAVDDTTFELRLSRPCGRVIESLAAPGARVPFIMPARVIGDDPSAPVTEVVGSGPFRFVADEWVPGSVVVYERFDGYVPRDEPPEFTAGGKSVNVDRVEWHVFRDPARAVQAMLRGEIDYWPTPPASARAALAAAPGVEMEEVDPLGFQGWIRPNQRRPPFDTVAGRQALERIVAAAGIGAATGIPPADWSACRAIFGCGTPLGHGVGATPRPAGDGVAAGRRLLAEAGYDGTALVLLDPVDVPVLDSAARAVAGALERAGAVVSLEATDWTGLAARRRRGGWDLFPTMWSVVDISEPGRHPGLGAAGAGELAGGVEAPELSQALSELVAASDPAERERLADALARTVEAHGAPYAIIGQWRTAAAHLPGVRDILPSPVPVFWNLRLDR